MILVGMLAGSGWAAKVLKMNLAELVQRADKIFKGQVLLVDYEYIRVAGADLRIARYQIRVEEGLKGSFDRNGIVELAMLAPQKTFSDAGPYQRVGLDLGLPQLRINQEYVLFTSQPSVIGLSTTVGLGQGCFHFEEPEKVSMVANEFGNAGLLDGIRENVAVPLSYKELTDLVRQFVR